MAKRIEVLASEYLKRRAYIAKYYLKESEGMMIFASSDILRNGLDNVYSHRQDSNYYYMTGIRESDGVLLMYKNNTGSFHEMLFLQDKDPNKEKWTGYRLGGEEGSKISGIEDVRSLVELDSLAAAVLNNIGSLYVNYNYSHMIGEAVNTESTHVGRIKKSHPHLNIKNALDVLRIMRTKKRLLRLNL